MAPMAALWSIVVVTVAVAVNILHMLVRRCSGNASGVSLVHGRNVPPRAEHAVVSTQVGRLVRIGAPLGGLFQRQDAKEGYSSSVEVMSWLIDKLVYMH